MGLQGAWGMKAGAWPEFWNMLYVGVGGGGGPVIALLKFLGGRQAWG